MVFIRRIRILNCSTKPFIKAIQYNKSELAKELYESSNEDLHPQMIEEGIEAYKK